MIYLLVTLDHLFRVSERVVAVSEVAEGASRVDERRGGGELLDAPAWPAAAPGTRWRPRSSPCSAVRCPGCRMPEPPCPRHRGE